MAKTQVTPEERSGFENAVANMFSNRVYANNYLFYAHILAQCKVIFDKEMEAPAGVNFMHDHYNLYINPTGKWVEVDPAQLANAKTKPKTRQNNGKTEVHIDGFNDFPLEHQLGVLKHEMLHIINSHVKRREDRDHRGFNIAADCAINQHIERTHLPKDCIFPDQFPGGKKVPNNLTAEQYYELIDKKDGEGGGGGSGPGGDGVLDDHSKWEETQGDSELQDDIAKNMIEKSITNTTKSRGNIPSQISDWLDVLSKRRELDWRTVLRNIVGNKRVGSRKTIMRSDRRLPNFEWIKGRTKDRKFDLMVISDVSGSVSDEALLSLWGEVRHICDITQSEVGLIQVDTQPSVPEKLKKNTKIIERKACGGTFLSPAIAHAKKYKVAFNAIVVTTDGYLSESDVEAFAATNQRVIWLIEKDGTIMDSMNSGKMQAFQLKE